MKLKNKNEKLILNRKKKYNIKGRIIKKTKIKKIILIF